MNSKKSESRKSVSECCKKCKKLCDKLLQFPECGHQICKRCLTDYLRPVSTRTDDLGYFLCQECGGKVEKPDLPIEKWSKVFSVKAKFYTDDPLSQPEKREIENASDFVVVNYNDALTRETVERSSKGIKDSRTDFVSVRGSSISKSKTLHRTAVRFSGFKSAEEFNSKISSDEKDCLYFGGGLMKNGDILLADWMNSCVKLFESSGQFICSYLLEDAPLDVTVVRDDKIVVSFGTTCNKVIFMTYKREAKELDIIERNLLKGFLYSTTKYEDRCVGIFERDDNRISIVQVNIDTSRGRSGSFRRSLTNFITLESGAKITSESSIFYNPHDRRLYITSRRKLFCFDKDRKLVFKKRFEYVGTDLYFLGSVTCDDSGSTYVASDNCILRVNKNGDLVSVLPTQKDPFHLLTGKDQRILLLSRGELITSNRMSIRKP